MKWAMMAMGVLAACGVCIGGAGVLGVEPPTEGQPVMTDEMKQQADEMAARNAPRAEHRLLESLCGEFDVTMRVSPMPGSEPMVLKATATREMILNGQIMQERVEAAGGPMPFTTLIHTAYNADAKGGGRFEVNRMSSTASCMMPERGTFDETTRTFTLSGAHEINGMTGSVRVVHRLLGDGKESADVYLAFDGYSEEFQGVKVPEYKAMVIEYARK